jgi:hypothetical protein
LTDLAQQASRKGGELAHWLQERDPADVLEEIRAYARRRPGTFLLLCGLAGVVAGRLTRSAVATRTELDTTDSGSAAGRAGLGGGYGLAGAAGGYPAAGYGTAPVAEPVAEPPVGRSTGVYGGSVESTEPATAGPYRSDPTAPHAGYVGTTRPLDDPAGDPTR